MIMSRTRQNPSRTRRLAAAVAATVLGVSMALAGATAANAVAIGVSIQATSPTTQPSGSTFTYQVNLACSGTNAPTCDDSTVTIPLDSAADMTDWGFDVSGGPTGFIQSWEVDEVAKTLVVTLANSIPAGSSQSIILSVTPPNLRTIDGTTWSLLPTVSSPDPDMTGTTAPSPAEGTATATVPLTVSKTSDGTFYEEGDTITYTLRATCPASKPVGSVYAASMTVSDTLPAGLTFVSSTPAPTTVGAAGELTWTYPDANSVPVACGGTAPTAAAETITVLATVGQVGGTGADFAPYENVPNTVVATATPLGGGEDATAEGSRTVVMLADGDPEIPGTHSIAKSSAAPLNRAATGNPDRRATYPGRWLPNGDNSTRPASVLDAAPATYTISPRIQYESFQYEIHDKLPCLTTLSGSGVYTQSAGLCAMPAFHTLGIRIDYSSGTAPATGYVPQYVDIAGVTHDLEPETSGSNWGGWVVPTAYIGRVSELVIPRDASQQSRLADNIRVYGYADPSTQNGQTLQNTASIDWFLGSATAATDAQTSDTADIFILNAPQIGLTKTMENVGGATGTQASVQLTATLFSPGTPTDDLVIADLLPANTTLATDPASVTASLTRPGHAAIPLANSDLEVEVIADHAPGQDLVRVTLPVSELPAEAGQFTLTVSPLVVDKPTEPGVYTNTARVFYDHPDLLPSCAAGSFAPDDADAVRGSATSNPANCAASATYRTVTSASGQFQLTKSVQGDYDSTPQEFPAVGHVKLVDGTAAYALNWQNTGAPNLDGVVLYDVFPHVGDTGVSGAQATEARGSQFRPILATIAAAPAGVTLAYSASADACRPEVYPAQGSCVDDWTTDPATLGGLANVLAIRAVSTAEYVTGEGFSINFTMSVPAIDKDLIAWNSVAAFGQTTAGTALLPTESPKVGITASDDRFTLGKVVDAKDAEAGDTLAYTVTVGNTGTRQSVATTVTDVLPVGVTFVSADHNGSYNSATRAVTWSVPALDRDATLELGVIVTVDSHQADGEIVNAVSIINPAGYSVPIVENPCASNPDQSCARTTVPVTQSLLARSGFDLPVLAMVLAALAMIAGLVLLRVRMRQSGRHAA